jgi:hypothetical protein
MNEQASETLNSAIYLGKVGHRRLSPKSHSFSYHYMMLLVDVDELPRLDKKTRLIGQSRFRPIRIKLSDHIPEQTDPQEFKRRIQDKVTELGGSWTGEQLLMMTQARFLGIYFSPVNFYFCYQQGHCQLMLAEVSNTPWGEKHWYLVDLAEPETQKDFHVSPFMPLEQNYRWRIKLPGEHFLAHIENWQTTKTFDATLRLKRLELTPKHAWRVFWRFPVMTLSIKAAIYWQAAKMFIKGFQFYPYSKSRG